MIDDACHMAIHIFKGIYIYRGVLPYSLSRDDMKNVLRIITLGALALLGFGPLNKVQCGFLIMLVI